MIAYVDNSARPETWAHDTGHIGRNQPQYTACTGCQLYGLLLTIFTFVVYWIVIPY